MELIDLAIDFETHYSSEYSLDKMPTAQYIMDERFEIIGVSYKLGDAPTVWISGTMEEIHGELSKLPWDKIRVIAHNARFEAAILEWRMGFRPASYFCTMVGSRPHLVPFAGGASLDALLRYTGLGIKGTYVQQAKGKHRADFLPEEMGAYRDYCINDTEGGAQLARKLSSILPADELAVIDATIKKYVRPTLLLNKNALVVRLGEIEHEKTQRLVELQSKHQVKLDEIRSRKKFSALLADALGSANELPTKTSKSTGQKTYAFAKDDIEFKALLTHGSERVRDLVGAKLFFSSTLEESRIKRLIEMHDALSGRLAVPLVYYGAHTGRFSGDELINLQNLPRVEYADKSKTVVKKGHLRFAVTAQPGYSIVAADLSNIEARIVATLSGQDDLREGFRLGRDIYASFASTVYQVQVHKDTHPKERFVGKTCLTGDTPVLCRRGWVRLDQVRQSDQVWDGVEWVCHEGRQDNGEQHTQDICGISLTPDHHVWSGTQWSEARLVAQDGDTLFRSLAIGAASLPSAGTCLELEEALRHCWSDATVGNLNTSWITTILRILNLRGAKIAGEPRDAKNAIGCMLRRCRKTITERDYSIDSRRLLLDVIHRLAASINRMEVEALKSVPRGAKIEPSFLDMLELSRAGTNQLWRWIAETTKGTTNPEISASLQGESRCLTAEQLRIYKTKLRVYDLLSAGPRHRFTVLTNNGPLIVHNCILGLGYGMGWRKFYLKMAQEGILMTEQEAKRIVYLYRATYPCIPQLWRDMDYAAQTFLTDRTAMYPWRGLIFAHERIILPNGMPIVYPGIVKTPHGIGFRGRFAKAASLGPQLAGEEYADLTNVWGGAFTENVAQALARIILTRAELKLAQMGIVAALQVHDELVFHVPTVLVDRVKKVIAEVMCEEVPWMPDLPVAVEVHHGATYGDAK